MSFLILSLLAASLSLSVGGASLAKTKDEVKEAPQVHRTLPVMPAVSNVTVGSWEVYSGTWADMFDGDTTTAYWLKEPTKNSYIDITFSTAVDIYDIQIRFGGEDFLRQGKFRWSNDGYHYMVIDSFDIEYNDPVNIKAYGVSATHLRLQSETEDNNKKWVKITELAINQGTFSSDLIQKISFVNFGENYLPTDAVGFETSLNSMVDNDPLTFTSFAGATANSTYIQFDFNQPTLLKSLTYQNSDAAKTYSDDHVYGAKFLYYDTTTHDYEDFPSFKTPQTVNTYDEQFFYVYDGRVTTSSVRFLINDVAGWIIAGDFKFNDSKWNFDDVIIDIDVNDATDYYQGAILNILDNDPSTYCWFNGKINSLTLDFGKDIQVNDVKFVTGNGSGGDTFDAYVAYCEDGGSSYTPLVSGYTPTTSDEIELQIPVTARYVRLVKDTLFTGWNSVKDFTVNNGAPTFAAYGENLNKPSEQDSSLNNAIDGDLETVLWYDYHFSSGTFFLLDLKEQTSVNNIVFLQGGHTHDSYDHMVWGNDDSLTDGKIEYSQNGSSWVLVDNDCTYFNNFYSFESPISARYVKVTYTGAQPASFGVVIRELAVNFTKVNPVIEWEDNLNPSYDGNPHSGFYRFPFASGCTYTYTKDRGPIYVTATEPTDPGTYEVTVSTAGNDIYNAGSDTATMHIWDTASHFIDDWNDMINAGNFCSKPDELIELIYRYDRDLSVADKATVAATTYTGADGKTYTIAEGIEYIRNREASGGENSGNNNSSILIPTFSTNDPSNGAVVVAIIIVTSLSTLLAFYFYQRSKHRHESN